MEPYQNEVRRSRILEILAHTYPNAKIALNYHNSWELLVAVVLSAQCTDIMVNKITERLFQKYYTIADYAKANQDEFMTDIKSVGFFRNKAKNIIASANLIQNKFSGKLPQTMSELTSLPGIARKSANIILGNAFQIVEGIAVDTHVSRISQRLDLVGKLHLGGKKQINYINSGVNYLDYFKDADPEKIENQLMSSIPKPRWFSISYEIINHGRSICNARNPKCESCPLNHICRVSRV